MTSEKLDKIFRELLQRHANSDNNELDDILNILKNASFVEETVLTALKLIFLGQSDLGNRGIVLILACIYQVGRNSAIEELTHIPKEKII